MTELQSVSAEWGIRVNVTAPIRHLCPHVDEVDRGTVTIAWTTGGDPDTDAGATVELHSLAALIESYATVRIDHETLALVLAQAVDQIPGLSSVEVRLSFVTAGLNVTASVDLT